LTISALPEPARFSLFRDSSCSLLSNSTTMSP
jgi:hypothetical protein